MPRLTVWVLIFLGAGWGQPRSLRAQTNEYRAFWVDAFHAGFKSSSEVTTLIDRIRNANGNAVVVEIRKRGDAYYTPNTTYADYEPHATDTSPANFDSLADLISKAHDTAGGKQRIEVHAWLVTWPIWGSSTILPADPQHPYNRHPDWLTRDSTGATWNGSQYCFDPGHPGAAEHTFRIAMNLVANYDLDGIDFDYVRYAGNTWGYNATAVSRFRARFGGTGNPSNTDPDWLQFRRDQVTAFIRRIYLNTIATKPHVKVSAATITWAPGPANEAAWYSSSSAWNSVLQDWRGWMEEGILDLNFPMAYFDQSGLYTQSWTNWCNFIRDHQYNRHALIGPGIYLNSTADAITQIRYSRAASPGGNCARGVCGYSYAVPDKSGTPFATLAGYLTNSPNAFDALIPAVFSQPAGTPAMPWKSSPANGHLMGTVFAGGPAAAADGAVVFLAGPVSRAQTNDGSGFYGFVDLPPGDYTVRATMPGMVSATNSVTMSAGAVKTSNLTLATNDSGVVSDIIIDNPAAFLAGAWTTNNLAAERFGSDYLYNGRGSGNEYAQFTPSILTPGSYQVFEWHSAGANRTTNAPCVVAFSGGSQTVYVNQETLGGQWNLLGAFNFAAGSSGYVRITDGFSDSGQVVVADAIKFVYVPPLLAPVVVAHPQDQTVKATSNATFTVTATGSSPLFYEWHFNGASIAGANSNTLTRLSVQPAWAGEYRVAITNVAGAVTSGSAFLTVLPLQPPLITSGPRPQAAVPGGAAAFSVAAASSSPTRFQWRLNSGDLAGEISDTLILSNLETEDFGDYSVRVSNDDGIVVSDPAALTLAVAPLLVPGLDARANLTLAFATEPGPIYAVQFLGSLDETAWQALTNIPGTGVSAVVLDAPGTNQLRFYRLKVQ